MMFIRHSYIGNVRSFEVNILLMSFHSWLGLRIFLTFMQGPVSHGANFNVTFSQTYGREDENVTFRCRVSPPDTVFSQLHWRKGPLQDNVFYNYEQNGKWKSAPHGPFKNRNVKPHNDDTQGIYDLILFQPTAKDIDVYWCQFHGVNIANTVIQKGRMYLAVKQTKDPDPVILSQEGHILASSRCNRSQAISLPSFHVVLQCKAKRSRPVSKITWSTGQPLNQTQSCDSTDACEVTSMINVSLPEETKMDISCMTDIPTAVPGRYITKTVKVCVQVEPGRGNQDTLTVVLTVTIVLVIVGAVAVFICVCIWRSRKNSKGYSTPCTASVA